MSRLKPHEIRRRSALFYGAHKSLLNLFGEGLAGVVRHKSVIRPGRTTPPSEEP